MIPTDVIVIDEWPLTENGKLDRAALPAPHGPHQAAFQAPTTAIERTLAGIWREVLDVERVGLTDDFFGLGGDSITAIYVAARARRVGLTISARDVFAHPTVGALATRMATAGGAEPGPVPLTPAQARFFALNPPVPSYWNRSALLQCPEPVDTERMRIALDALAVRHDALRLRFVGGEQRLEPVAPAPVVVQVEAASLESAAAAAQASLDIEAARLLTAVVCGSQLLVVVHYLAADLMSWPVLLEDLQALYEGRELGPPPSSFAQWARSRTTAADAATVAPSGVGVAGTGTVVHRHVPNGARARRDVLAAALAVALAAQTGRSRIQFDLEEREAAGELYGTVGCLAMPRLVALDVAAGDTHRRVKALLAEPPNSAGGADVLLRLRPPSRGWQVLPCPGPERAAANPRPYRTEVTCSREPGGDLEITFDASSDVTVVADAMLDELRALLDAPARYVPTDFPDAGITADALERAIWRLRRSR